MMCVCVPRPTHHLALVPAHSKPQKPTTPLKGPTIPALPRPTLPALMLHARGNLHTVCCRKQQSAMLAARATACGGMRLAVLTSALFPPDAPQLMTAQADAAPAGALDPKEFKPFKLIKKEQLTHNTYLLR